MAKDYTQRFDGDRRFFELQVAYKDKNERMEGKLVNLAEKKGKRTLPRRGAYTVAAFTATSSTTMSARPSIRCSTTAAW